MKENISQEKANVGKVYTRTMNVLEQIFNKRFTTDNRGQS